MNEFIFWRKLSRSVGPNSNIIGILARDIICITPLSMDTAVFNLDAKAVTRAGQDNLEFSSGNKAAGT